MYEWTRTDYTFNNFLSVQENIVQLILIYPFLFKIQKYLQQK